MSPHSVLVHTSHGASGRVIIRHEWPENSRTDVFSWDLKRRRHVVQGNTDISQIWQALKTQKLLSLRYAKRCRQALQGNKAWNIENQISKSQLFKYQISKNKYRSIKSPSIKYPSIKYPITKYSSIEYPSTKYSSIKFKWIADKVSNIQIRNSNYQVFKHRIPKHHASKYRTKNQISHIKVQRIQESSPRV